MPKKILALSWYLSGYFSRLRLPHFFPSKIKFAVIKCNLSLLMFSRVNLMEFICTYTPCVLYLHLHMSIILSLISHSFLHADLAGERYFYWFVMVSDCFTHPSTMLGNINGFDISSDTIFIFLCLLSKMLGYSFTSKNYRRDASGPSYVKSKMVLSINISPGKFRDSCSKCWLVLSVVEHGVSSGAPQ